MPILKSIRLTIRELTKNRIDKNRLINKNPTIIASDCIGGVIYHDLGLEFLSPTINMFFSASDYIKFLQDLQKYLDCEMIDITKGEDEWPMAQLDDIKLQLVHYSSVEEARNKWDIRKKRININNIFVIFNDRNGFSEQLLLEFEKLEYKKKICFVSDEAIAKKYKNCFFIREKDPDNTKQIYPLMGFVPKLSTRRVIDEFDYVGWLNGEKDQ